MAFQPQPGSPQQVREPPRVEHRAEEDPRAALFGVAFESRAEDYDGRLGQRSSMHPEELPSSALTLLVAQLIADDGTKPNWARVTHLHRGVTTAFKPAVGIPVQHRDDPKDTTIFLNLNC
jgi:hypothetical protein